MLYPSIRGVGIRYMLALALPITGVVLVLYTVAQLFGFSFHERRKTSSARRSTLAGSTAAVHEALPDPGRSGASPKK